MSAISKPVIPTLKAAAASPVAASFSAPAAAPVAPMPQCAIDQMDDGSMLCRVLIPADVAARIRTRAGTHPLDTYLWDNLLRAALYSHVY